MIAMKSKLISLVIALVAGAGTLSADIIERVKIDDLYYHLNTETRTAEVTWEVFDGISITTNYIGLTSVDIPSSVSYNGQTYTVTSIGETAFYDCENLTSVTIPDGVTSIGSSAFHLSEKLTSITIPNSVTSIADYAFFHCQGLTSVTIPTGTTSVGYHVFDWCTSLTSVILHNNLTIIEDYAFTYCTSLTSITLPASLTTIKYYAFMGSTSLTSVICEGEVPPALVGDGIFFQTGSSMEIIVPCEGLEAYKEAWSAYSSKIRSIPAAAKTVSSDTILGRVSVPQTRCDSLITATANYGYHFTQWSDGNTDNPRLIDAMQDETYTAEFAKNIYTITDQSDNVQGAVSGAKQGEYLDEVQLTAVAKYGYRFTQWSDGVTDNPRYLILTCDTAFTAEFVPVIEANVNYLDKGGSLIKNEHIALYAPEAPEIEGFTFVKWQAGGDTEEGIVLQAVYESNTPTSAPVVVNPANRAQKLIRNGNVYIRTETKTYNVQGLEVK